MNKPILYLDIDNVVFNTVEAIKFMYDEDFRLYNGWIDVPVQDIKSYSFKELQLLDNKRLNEYFCSGRFFDIVACFEGAESSMCSLNQLNDIPIVLVSLGTPENIRGKRIWVNTFNQAFGTDIELIGVHDFDKSQIDMSGGILVDDLPQNLISSNADIKICFGDYEWNKDWEGVKAENWSKLRGLIYGEVKKHVKSNN